MPSRFPQRFMITKAWHRCGVRMVRMVLELGIDLRCSCVEPQVSFKAGHLIIASLMREDEGLLRRYGTLLAAQSTRCASGLYA